MSNIGTWFVLNQMQSNLNRRPLSSGNSGPVSTKKKEELQLGEWGKKYPIEEPQYVHRFGNLSKYELLKPLGLPKEMLPAGSIILAEQIMLNNGTSGGKEFGFKYALFYENKYIGELYDLPKDEFKFIEKII